MFVLGITGGIGCGKSTVAHICREAGLPVVDADELAHVVTGKDGAAIPELIEQFGPSIIDENGALNRKKMADRVFRDRKNLDQLSVIVHRHVLETMRQRVEALEEKNKRAVVLDVPIPVKHGFLDLCDQVWVVWTREDLRIERLAARGMTEEEARRRMAMQMSEEEYSARADHVIQNNNSLDDLRQTVMALLKQELGERGIRICDSQP
jgi:dephospho-CoA kinase